MDCVACGVRNQPGRKFCSDCGARLSVLCAACGTANLPSDRYCGECGAALVTEPAATAAGPTAVPSPVPTRTAAPGPDEVAAAATTERRLVSVMFVDLVGFTPYSESHDPEDVQALLTRYFDEASAAVQRHAGVVEKFIGDAVMAVWGLPVAQEDDAERAVRTALEVVQLVEAIGRDLGVVLQARGGVLTGEAVADLVSADRGSVIGDLVNTASRLQTAAAAGTVLVGEHTYRAASAAISFEPVEALQLKGKREAVPAWRALSVLGQRGGWGRTAAPEPPFVGRSEDLRLTKELLHATGRDHRPRLLHLSGVAGIGKSRVVWELRKYVDGLSDVVYWHEGRCPAYGDGVDFWAFAAIVRGRMGITDSDDDDVVRDKLGAGLRELVDDDAERAWIEPRLAHLLGLQVTRPGEREELFGAWRRFVERVAERGTVVLVFEDLHRADPGLLDFVESLLQWSRTSPILVLTVARPELREQRPAWGAIGHTTTVHLDRLADEDIAAMVTGYVDGLPAEGLARLVERAEGVPMYAVETVRMLADRGVLEQHEARYRAVADLDSELDIPVTLQALVAARLDGLAAPERAFVQDAAVAGHSFTLDAVCAVGGLSRDQAEPILGALVRKEVLGQDADPRSPGRGRYHFLQSVNREVAYATLSRTARRRKHLACAAWFDALSEDDLAGVVASHYLEAYRADPGAVDLPAIAERATSWLVRAGDRAASLGSQEPARTYAELALTLTDDLAVRQGLHLRAGLAAANMGDHEAASAHVASSRTSPPAASNVQAEIRLLVQLVRLAATREDDAVATGWLRELLVREPPIPAASRSLVLSALAQAAATGGDVGGAVHFSDEAITLAETTTDADALREATAARAWALELSGHATEAHALFESYVAQAAAGGSPFEEAAAYMQFGVFLWEEDPRRAIEAELRAAGLAGRAGVLPLRAMALTNAAEAAVDLGEWEVAEEALAEADAIDTSQEGYDANGRALTRSMLLAHRGAHQQARTVLDELESQRWELWSAVQMRTWYLRISGLCRLLAHDDLRAAADAWRLVEEFDHDANTSGGLFVLGPAAAGRRDPASIRRYLAATESLQGPWVERARRTLSATAEALEGHVEDPTEAFEAVLADWLTAELPMTHAFAVLCAVRSLPADRVPREHVARARAYLQGLGAVALGGLIDDATSTPTPSTPTPDATDSRGR